MPRAPSTRSTQRPGSVSFAPRGDHLRRQVAPVALGDVDVERRLVDPLVAHPRLQRPRVHAAQRGVGPERVAQRVPPLLRQASSAADPEDHRVRWAVRLGAAVRFPHEVAIARDVRPGGVVEDLVQKPVGWPACDLRGARFADTSRFVRGADGRAG